MVLPHAMSRPRLGKEVSRYLTVRVPGEWVARLQAIAVRATGRSPESPWSLSITTRAALGRGLRDLEAEWGTAAAGEDAEDEQEGRR